LVQDPNISQDIVYQGELEKMKQTIQSHSFEK
jgi:hypothetical protein